jgi:hypothetical protein
LKRGHTEDSDKVVCEALEEKIGLRYPIFKPVSLPDFQIANDGE